MVLLKGPKKLLHISLASALMFVGLWIIGVSGLKSSLGGYVLYGRLIYASAALGMYSLYVFVYCIARDTRTSLKRFLSPLSMGVITVLSLVIVLTPLILKSVTVIGRNKFPEPVFGPLYPLFISWVLYIASAIIVLLLKARAVSKGRIRSQAQVVLLGLTLFVFTAIMTNAILPHLILRGTSISSQTPNLTPLSAVLLAFALSYVVLKHKFLNIRLIIARSVAYILSLSTIAGAYSLSWVGLANVISARFSQTAQQIFFVAITMIAALSYNSVKRVFDKATNRVFYRDAYDAQEFLDRLNKVLVATIELEPLLMNTSRIIADTLKSEFCMFGIKETGGQQRRIIGTVKPRFSEEDIMAVRKFTPQTKNKLVVRDDIPDKYADVREILNKGNIAIIARLTNTPHSEVEGYGYLLLGDKRSGNPYSRQDLRIIEIITDELVIAVQNALRFEEIENFNIRLREEVTHATKELRVTNDRLRELDQTKDDFISMASHQLRTPLTSVKGYVSMVLEGDVGKVNPMQHKLLEQAFISSQRMVYLIADLLNVSRLRTGKFVIESQPTDLSSVIAGETDQLRDIAKSRGLTLTYNRPEHFPTLMLDEAKIRQVIMNFTDNAIYYTSSGGSITLNLTDKPDSVEFTVVDTGIGVPKSEQHRLFTKFYRAANAKKARPDGTGLGLFMAKKVVAAQGGAIIFNSQEGKGSTFGFTFPKAKLLTTQPPKQHHKTHLSV